MHIPTSTYRVQLHKDFTFKHLRDIVDYLYAIGISTIYASPILRSTPGSQHGYDVVDPQEIDPEIGTIEDLRGLATLLKEKKMSWVQDIVPNHMAFHSENKRLMDVLERGTASGFYRYFDIDWDHSRYKGKVCAPFLGKKMEECLRDGELRLQFSPAGFTIRYFETSYPLSITAVELLENVDMEAGDLVSSYSKQAQTISAMDEWLTFKAGWAERIMNDAHLRGRAERICSLINGDQDLLRRILHSQHYLLTHWKDSDTVINYRRFFTVNELICLRMEDEAVFNDYHRFLFSLYDQDLVQGFRIDHIDGLYDPSQYVTRLRQAVGENCYIIAEKILEAKEAMPESWPLQGTSGYEFLSFVSQLVTDRSGARKLLSFYNELVPDLPPYSKIVFQNKKLILDQYMAGELDNLLELFIRVGLQGNFTRERIKEALGIFMVSLPVYRIYPGFPLSARDCEVLNETKKRALDSEREYTDEIEYIHKLFTCNDGGAAILKFLKRTMQFTGPLTAKGVEDTTFYVYNPLISHDEVGDAPSMLGISIQSFHSKMDERSRSSPLSLNATATHDTKRGEDSRLRLNILSEIPEEWIAQTREWLDMNATFVKQLHGARIPTLNDEYFIYQSLIGGYPGGHATGDDFFERFNEFLTKAIREAKVNSNWSEPNITYEQGCVDFVKHIFSNGHVFRDSLQPFIELICRYAYLYSLGQVVIKITAPGIPDIYQGCELWDLSFVDPDNRRPVDYPLRRHHLDDIFKEEAKGNIKLFHFLKTMRQKGLEKLFVTAKALSLRRQFPDLFSAGEYVPLSFAQNEPVAIGYARMHLGQWALVVIPLAIARNRENAQPYAHEPDPRKYFTLPSGAPSRWRNIFTGETLSIASKLTVFEALRDFPVAVFINI
jgi:(1->4)-alpha-D-glucan 1-alpha-D-glucosylmutase